MNNEQTIATEILNQLGGRRFLAMTGSKNLMSGSDENGNVFLRMNLTRNKIGANYLKITLDPCDTYSLTFCKVSPKAGTVKTLHECSDVYCDMLQGVFTSVTGLYTSL